MTRAQRRKNQYLIAMAMGVPLASYEAEISLTAAARDGAAIAIVIASLVTPAFAGNGKSFIPAELPRGFSCSTDSDCEYKVSRLGCIVSDDSRTGFLCWRKK